MVQDLSFTDKSFDSNQSLLYHLSIQISLDGFSFCILDIPKGKYILLKDIPLYLKRPRLLYGHIKDIIEKEDILNKDFKSIDILYTTSKFTLVPQAVYSDTSGKDYYKFNISSRDEVNARSTLISEAKAWCVFNIPENLTDYLSEKFPKARLYHHIFPIIQTSLQQNRNIEEKKQVLLNFFRNNFDIVVIKGSELLLYNNFEYRNDKDVLYYVMFIFDQLKLSPEKTEVVFHGKISPSAQPYHLLKKYINRVSFARLDSTYLYSYAFNKIPDHYYSTLLNLYKCG